MKAYIVDNAKLRNAMNTIAKKKGTNWSILLREKSTTTDSSVRRAEMMFEKYSSELEFEPDEYGLYGLYYEDILRAICKTFGLEADKFIVYELDRSPSARPSYADLTKRVDELEERVTKLIYVVEELRKSKEVD